MLFAALVLLCLTGLPAAAQSLPQTGLAAEKIRAIETLISSEMSRQSIPGMSIAVAGPGNVYWSNGYGMADMENFVPAKASTVYRLASISKPITAVAAMQLVQARKLDLDAPVERYVAGFPKKQWPVTTRQLLAHLGGVRHYKDEAEPYSTKHYSSVAEALQTFQDDALVHEPGTRYLYTTFGFVLAGAVVEGASGIAYSEYVRRNIFDPAGMTSIYMDDVYTLIPNRSRGYFQTAAGLVENAPLADTSNKIPGGGMASTAGDLVKFAQAVGGGKLLSREMVETMWTPQRTRDGKSTYYGLGWGVGEIGGRRQVSHTGGQAGVSTVLRYLPGDQMAVAMMFNLQGVAFGDLADKIVKILLQ
ncbi:MAG TPA: serine hydrolase domain-containing protein [Bryobacteraceae bacterium]|nr:serine hydrolase domain-containing protein [Bryobacteraceae bacterium]